MGARLHRAAEQERAVQEGRRPAQRPRPDPVHLLQARLRLDRPRRPARPVPVDGALHPARAGLRRRQDRDARGGGARRRVLHDAGPLRRPAAARRHGAGARRGRPRSTPATPPTSPTGRTSSTTGSGSRTSPRSGRRWTRPGWTRPRRAATRRGPSSARRSPASPRTRSSTAAQALEEIKRRYIGNPAFSNLPRKFKTALTGHPSHDVSPETNDIAFVGTVHPDARPGLRPLGRRRPVDQPDAGPEARRLDPDRRGGRRLGGRRLDLPRLRLPPAALAGPAEVPGRRLGRREVPRGARERVPRPAAGLLRLAALPRRPPRPRRRPRAEGRPASTSASRRSPAGSPAPCWSRSPT